MISGPSLRIALLAPILLLMSGRTPAGSLEDLEKRLAREPPVSTPFAEYRFSRVLKRPASASGTLEYRADGVLVRDVDHPYRERTLVSGDNVTLQREGRAERRFPLERAPQLRVLLDSFRALLDGRLSTLRRDFTVNLDEAGRGWTITLTPLDATLTRRLTTLRIDGTDDRPTCLTIAMSDGVSHTLLGPVTRVSDAPTRAELEAICRTPPAAP
jgi:hypothetical protein